MFVFVCLFVCVLRPINSEVIYRRHPHLLSLPKDVKLDFYIVFIGYRTPGRVAVHYTTAAPRQLLYIYNTYIIYTPFPF